MHRCLRRLKYTIAIVVSLGLVGCGGGSEDNPRPDGSPTASTESRSSYDIDGDGLYSADDLRAAIIGRFGEYRFPAQYQITGEQLADQVLGSFPPEQLDNSMFEAGGEYLFIGSYHQCAWERVYLQATGSGDAARQQEALDVLTASLPTYSLESNGRAMFEDYYRRAELGDPSGVANDVNVNCNGIGLATPVAGT